MPRESGKAAAAGGEPAAAGVRRIRLTRTMLTELRLRLLEYASPISVDLELVEECYGDGYVVVRLARVDMPERGELILGHYREAEPAEHASTLDFAA